MLNSLSNGTHTWKKPLEERNKDSGARSQQGRIHAGRRYLGGMQPLFYPSGSLESCLFSINAAMGQSKTLLSPLLGHSLSDLPLRLEMDFFQRDRILTLPSPPPKGSLMLAYFNMHEQGRYINSHLLKSDNCKYVCGFVGFQAKSEKNKRGFHECYFGKYFSQGHRLVNKMITRNYSMYHEYFLVCTEQFKAL